MLEAGHPLIEGLVRPCGGARAGPPRNADASCAAGRRGGRRRAALRRGRRSTDRLHEFGRRAASVHHVRDLPETPWHSTAAPRLSGVRARGKHRPSGSACSPPRWRLRCASAGCTPRACSSARVVTHLWPPGKGFEGTPVVSGCRPFFRVRDVSGCSDCAGRGRDPPQTRAVTQERSAHGAKRATQTGRYRSAFPRSFHAPRPGGPRKRQAASEERAHNVLGICGGA